MKKTSPASLLLLPILIACQQPANARQPAADTGMLSIGAPVRGEITSKDRINYSDGSRSVVYALDLDADQAVRLEATGALCARLVVLRDGERIAGPNEPSCAGTNDSASSLLSIMAPEKGRYEVAVSGAGARAYGPFRLEAKALQVHRGDGPLRAGSDIADFLRGEGKRYRIDVRETGYYVIDMRSSEFDSMLELSGNGVAASNDDGGDNLNARLRVPLEPGTYTLHAKSANDSATGMFELSLSTGALPAGVRLRNSGDLSTDGNALTGALAGSAREYQLRVTQPSRVVIDLSSEDFDTVLELAGNGVSQENDDGPDGTNSRLTAILQPGTYQVRARSLSDGGSGLFRLSATREAFDAGNLRNGGPLPFDTTLVGMLSGRPLEYALVVAQAGDVVIDMTSDEIDTVLELHRDGDKVAEDDDGGGNGNARLGASVRPGTYTVIARAFSEQQNGLFELRARMGGTDAVTAPAAGSVPSPPSR